MVEVTGNTKIGRPKGSPNKAVRLQPEDYKKLIDSILNPKPSPELDKINREINEMHNNLKEFRSLYEIQAENIKRVNEAIRAGR